MKTWEHETIRDGMSQRGTLADWPELREALANNGVSLPGLVSMKAVREICRLILAERKTTDTAESVVSEWVRGEREYPGDIYVLAAMDEYISDHINQRQHGTDVLASARLDDAERLIAKLRSCFSL